MDLLCRADVLPGKLKESANLARGKVDETKSKTKINRNTTEALNRNVTWQQQTWQPVVWFKIYGILFSVDGSSKITRRPGAQSLLVH